MHVRALDTVKHLLKGRCVYVKAAREESSRAERVEGDSLRLENVVREMEEEAEQLRASLISKGEECFALQAELFSLRTEVSSLRGEGAGCPSGPGCLPERGNGKDGTYGPGGWLPGRGDPAWKGGVGEGVPRAARAAGLLQGGVGWCGAPEPECCLPWERDTVRPGTAQGGADGRRPP